MAAGRRGVGAHIFNDKQEAKTVSKDCWGLLKPPNLPSVIY